MGKTNFSFTLIWCKYSFSAQDHSFCHQSRQTFLNQKNGVKNVTLFTTVLCVLYPQIYKQCIIFFYLILLAPHLIFFFQFPPWIFNHWMSVVSFNTWTISSSVGITSTLWAQTKKNNTVQCWKLTLVFLPIQVWKASGEYKSLITHPFSQYKFHFWVKLKIFITLFFIFHFGKNISQQKLTGLINGCQF